LKELHEKSAIDALTGAVSRRAGIDLLNITFEQSRRQKTPLSLVLFDLDHFKSVNDRHGHDAGDQLLREVVAGLKRRLRQQDAIIRWGGEELLVALPGASASEAAGVVSALCRNGLALRPDSTPQTASAGLAERESDQAASWQELVELADVRMYRAKEFGRNYLCGPAELSLRLFPGERAVIEHRADGPSLLPKIADQDRIPRLSV
jgi:diguanylate cyclase (GGDEF)-like protein